MRSLDAALAWGVLAQRMSMLSSESARPNCVIPAPWAASGAATRKMPAWSL